MRGGGRREERWGGRREGRGEGGEKGEGEGGDKGEGEERMREGVRGKGSRPVEVCKGLYM